MSESTGMDMIEVFRLLTDDKEDNCFEDILSTHYEKFRIFYDMICDYSAEAVVSIDCIEYNSQSHLVIKVEFNNKKDSENFRKDVKIEYEEEDLRSYFDITIKRDKKKVHITVTNTLEKEGDVYGNFTDSY